MESKTKTTMQRINFMLPPQMLDALGELVEQTGQSLSEHLRAAITAYIKEQHNEQLGRKQD